MTRGAKEEADILLREDNKTEAVKKLQGIQRATKAYLSKSIRKSGLLEHRSLDSGGIPLSFPKVNMHAYAYTHRRMLDD